MKVKEFVDDSAGNVAWNTVKVNKLIESLEESFLPKEHPFHEGNPEIRKSNISFNYTDREIAEIKKCAKDVVYFANTYCKVMTEDGYEQVVLRDYQEDILRQFMSNQHNILLSARQIGKCHLYNTVIEIRNTKTGEIEKITIGDLYNRVKPKKTFLYKIKGFLYKILNYLG